MSLSLPNFIHLACVFCNGDSPVPHQASALVRKADLLIAADGGARHLLDQGWTPHVIIGDMDSLPEDSWPDEPGIRRLVYPADKDRTDTELAIDWALDQGAERVVLLGASGGRLDHLLGHAALLLHHPGRLLLADGGSLVQAVAAGQSVDFQTHPGALVSLVPFERPTRVTTTGLQYPLNREHLASPTHGLSNVAVAPNGMVTVHEGLLILCVEGQLL